jgi:hypothetical protein
VTAGRGLLDLGKRLANGRESFPDPAGLETRLGEKSEPMRHLKFGADRAVGADPRAQPGKPLFRLALFDASPADKHLGTRDVKRKDLLGGEGESRLRRLEIKPGIADRLASCSPKSLRCCSGITITNP